MLQLELEQLCDEYLGCRKGTEKLRCLTSFTQDTLERLSSLVCDGKKLFSDPFCLHPYNNHTQMVKLSKPL